MIIHSDITTPADELLSMKVEKTKKEAARVVFWHRINTKMENLVVDPQTVRLAVLRFAEQRRVVLSGAETATLRAQLRGIKEEMEGARVKNVFLSSTCSQLEDALSKEHNKVLQQACVHILLSIYS